MEKVENKMQAGSYGTFLNRSGEGNSPLVDCVTHRFDVEHSQDALQAVRNGETVKAVITP